MTIEELYTWAKKKGITDFNIYARFRNGDCVFPGSEEGDLKYTEVNFSQKRITI